MSEATKFETFSDEEKTALKTFRSAVKEEFKTDVDDITCIRFLRARKLNHSKALEMFRNWRQWRIKNDVDNILSKPQPNAHILRKVCPDSTGRVHLDKHGRPIYIQLTGKIHATEFHKLLPEEVLQPTHIWFMEQTCKTARESAKARGEGVYQVVTILDMEGIGMGHGKLASAFRTTAVIDQNYYPEFAGAMYMINCPSYFPVLYGLCKPFLDAKTQSKIRVLGTNYREVLLAELGEEGLPERYGGKCHCSGGCLEAPITREELKKANLWIEDDSKDRELIDFTVSARSKHILTFPVEQAKDVVSWYFRTVSHDISFNVTWFPNFPVEKTSILEEESSANSTALKALNIKEEVVVAPTRSQSSKVAVKGSYQASTKGVVRFMWDNTYSRLTSKRVRYFVDVGATAQNIRRDTLLDSTPSSNTRSLNSNQESEENTTSETATTTSTKTSSVPPTTSSSSSSSSSSTSSSTSADVHTDADADVVV